MDIIVKLPSGESFILNVDIYDTAKEVKEKIQKVTSIPEELQRLYFAGKQMEGDYTIRNYNLGLHSTIHVMIIPKGA